MSISKKSVFMVFMALVFLFSCTGKKGVFVRPSAYEPSGNQSFQMSFDQYKETGEKYFLSKDFENAAKMFRSALAENNNDPHCHYRLGIICAKMNKAQEGIHEFLVTIKIDEKHSKAHFNLGAIYATDGPHQNIKMASYHFKRYLDLEPGAEDRSQIMSWLEKHLRKEIIPPEPEQKSISQEGDSGSHAAQAVLETAPHPQKESSEQAPEIKDEDLKGWLIEELRKSRE